MSKEYMMGCVLRCWTFSHNLFTSRFRASLLGLFISTPLGWYLDRKIDEAISDEHILIEALVSNLAVLCLVVSIDLLAEFIFRSCCSSQSDKETSCSYLVKRELASGIVAFLLGFIAESIFNVATHDRTDLDHTDPVIAGVVVPVVRLVVRLGIFISYDKDFGLMKKITRNLCQKDIPENLESSCLVEMSIT